MYFYVVFEFVFVFWFVFVFQELSLLSGNISLFVSKSYTSSYLDSLSLCSSFLFPCGWVGGGGRKQRLLYSGTKWDTCLLSVSTNISKISSTIQKSLRVRDFFGRLHFWAGHRVLGTYILVKCFFLFCLIHVRQATLNWWECLIWSFIYSNVFSITSGVIW